MNFWVGRCWKVSFLYPCILDVLLLEYLFIESFEVKFVFMYICSVLGLSITVTYYLIGIGLYLLGQIEIFDFFDFRFCFACIDNWATITNLCPLCQNEFQLITCVPVSAMKLLIDCFCLLCYDSFCCYWYTWRTLCPHKVIFKTLAFLMRFFTRFILNFCWNGD